MSDPVFQLVLALTAVIGVVLGFFLPRVVYGYGLDRRGGAVRYEPRSDEKPALFTYGGQQFGCEIRGISLTGALLMLPGAPMLMPGRHGILLVGRDRIPVSGYVVRLVEEHQGQSGMLGSRAYAVQFASQHRSMQMAPKIRQRLSSYLIAQAPMLPST